MLDRSQGFVPEATLTGSVRDYRFPTGADLLGRTAEFFNWQDQRRSHSLWPYARALETRPSATCEAADDSGRPIVGVNFASQDYLSLASHAAVREAAIEAIMEFGVHSAGSPALVGNTSLSVELELRIAAFLGVEEAVLFPTGWGAGFGAIKGLVRANDHVVFDALSHSCLQEGANAATRNISVFRHLDLDHCRRLLGNIRSKDAENGIMVVTESLFSMDSDTPDIAALQDLCHEFGATLLVDAAHDLGCLGPGGRGHIGLQNMVGKVDLVMGSFSKTFASNGGFIACRDRRVKEYLRYYSAPATFSNAVSPAQAATVLKALDIVESGEGNTLRGKLMANIVELRKQLTGKAMSFYGEPSPIVSVKVGSEALARLVSRRLPELGLLANLVEYPAVGKGAARFRMQVMANHTTQNIADAADCIYDGYRLAVDELELIGLKRPGVAA